MQELSWAKGTLKTEAHEETKYSKANAIIKIAHYDGNRKFTLNHYYNLVAKSFFQLEEFILKWTKGSHTYQLFHHRKREWNKLPANQMNFYTYYNSM